MEFSRNLTRADPKKKSRFTDSLIVAVLKQADGGTRVHDMCRQHGISSATFYKWRSKFGGMDASMVSQLNELRDENRRLKNTYAEAQPSADLLKGALKEMVRSSQRRETAKRAVQAGLTKIADACQTLGVSPACYRYQAKASQENAIIVD